MRRKGNPSALNWVWTISGKAKIWPVVQSLVRICQGAIAIAYAYSLGKVVDAAASGHMDSFFREFLLFGLYNIASLLLLLVNRYLAERSRNALDKAFRIRVFSQLLHRDYGQISQRHTGEWMTRITSDTSVIAHAVSMIIPEILGASIKVVGALIALLQIIPQIAVFLIPGGVLMACISLLMQKKLKALHKSVQRAEGKTRSFMHERLSSLLVIHAFTQENASQETAGQRMDQLNAVRMRRALFAIFCNAALGGAMVTAQILGIGMCGIGILQNTISYGKMSTVLYLVNMLETPLKGISSYISQYYAMLASAERLMEIETFPLDCPDDPVSQEEIDRYYTQQLDAFGLEHADFAYEDGDGPQVLQDFSLMVRKGEFVAFTGDSGCGKSTSLKILLNLFPLHSGNIYRQDMDGTRHPLDAAWRGLFAYVPQGNQLISGTVRETITFSDPEQMSQDEQLYRALEIACAATFVRELPDGLDTVLGERGSGLSEGQMQRLSIARAVLSGRPILLLDEATSALDAATEEQLLKNLRAMTNRTVLIITHREAALNFCDKRIHFEKHHP